jgi:hypothetical protein
MARAFPEQVLGRAVLRERFAYERNSGVERTPMDSGLARGRLFNANPTAKVQTAFAWSEFQVAFFEAWLQTVAGRGAYWFTIYLPLEGVSYRQVLARVDAVPQRYPRGGLQMQVPIDFEVHDSVILPDGIVELVLEFGTTGVGEMDAALAACSLQPFLDAWGGAFGGTDG